MKKKRDSYFIGVGLDPSFRLGLLLFIEGESRTPIFKILVRTLHQHSVIVICYLLFFIRTAALFQFLIYVSLYTIC